VEAMHASLRFWLDRGVDGFRIDVIHRIAKDPLYAISWLSHDDLGPLVRGTYAAWAIERLRSDVAPTAVVDALRAKARDDVRSNITPRSTSPGHNFVADATRQDAWKILDDGGFDGLMTLEYRATRAAVVELAGDSIGAASVVAREERELRAAAERARKSERKLDLEGDANRARQSRLSTLRAAAVAIRDAGGDYDVACDHLGIGKEER